MNAAGRLIVITIGIFLLAALLAGRSGIEHFVTNNVTLTVIVVLAALWWVSFHKQRGSDPVLQGLFASAGTFTFLILVAGLFFYRREAQRYVTEQFCHSSSTVGRIVGTVVCAPLGLR